MKPAAPWVLGVDPGTANIGFVLLDPDGTYADCRYVKTTPGDGPVAQDDVRRLLIAIDAADAWSQRPLAVVVEWYAPRGRQRAGWKTALTVGALVAWARLRGVHLHVAQPAQRTAASSNKAKVVRAMRRRLGSVFRSTLDGMPTTAHEHIADAAAHAVAWRDRWTKGS